MFVAFIAYIGLLYVLSLGLKWFLSRLGIAPSAEALIRVLLGIAAAVGLAFIMRGVTALSLP